MKNIFILVIVVLVVGGGAWAFLGMERGEEVIEREEEADMDEEELMGIITKGKEISSMSYEVEMYSPEATMEGSFWQKGEKIRMEGKIEMEEAEKGIVEEEMIVIVDNKEKVAYTYIPAQDMAVKIGLEETEEVQDVSMKGQSTDLSEKQPVIVGVETLRGKECIVVEYTAEEGTTGKMWIWKKHGIPIRVESDETVIEAKNIEFGEIPDGKFELPEGVEPMEIPNNMPSEIPSGDFNPEDIDL